LINLNDLPKAFIALARPMPSGCWYWKGQVIKRQPVHRLEDGQIKSAVIYAWEHFNGPKPEGHSLYRACHSIACLNPEHRLLRETGKPGIKGAAARVRKKRELHEHWKAVAAKLGM
jgi:hypothetical protein